MAKQNIPGVEVACSPPSPLKGEADPAEARVVSLATSRNKYALLYDLAPVGYFTFDRDGMILTVNPCGAELLQSGREALIGHRFTQYLAEDDCATFTGFLGNIFSGTGRQTCRVRLAVRDAVERSVRIEALATDAGQECLAVLVDITQKQRAEQALAESENNLARAQAMTQVGSWSFTPDNSEITASAELLRIMRLRPEETTQEAFARVVHPEDHETVLEKLRMGIETGQSYQIEHRLQFDDGSIRWVYTIVEPVFDETGRVSRVYGTTQDITQRKQAEVDLSNKTNELQAIFDSIGDGIAVYDHRGIIQHHNQIGPQIFPLQLLPGKSCRDIFHPETPRLPHVCAVERALKGERVDTSLVLEQEGRETRHLDITATPIRDALDGRNRALVFFRDVTAKRMQEMHLIQTEKMSSIGVLATGIAHEINNPLTSVAGFAEALQRRLRDNPPPAGTKDFEDFPSYLDMIVRESYRCKEIIDYLLNFGRKSDGHTGQVDINMILVEILELLKQQLRSREIEILRRLDPELGPVPGDASALRQVFMNLLVNAYQAIDGPGKVSVISATDTSGRLAVTISDSGRGMAPGIIERIWEPFFTTKEVGKGIGLGLALTYDTVKRHGGEIKVTSKLGAGSSFTVLLPTSQMEKTRQPTP